MRSGNPALRSNTFTQVKRRDSSKVMTIQGTTNKTIILLSVTIGAAYYAWINPEQFLRFWWALAIGGFVIALITIFKKEWSPFTAPVYALVEGLFLGAISLVFEQIYPGIVMQAIGLTFGTLFSLLIAYKSRLIKVTKNFRLGVVAATGAIALIYLVSIGLRFFDIGVPYIHESGVVGIGFSLFVVVIAALNLVLDFDFIEHGADVGAPKYMEWYGAFGLIVTLIWLYLEILRLLAKIRD